MDRRLRKKTLNKNFKDPMPKTLANGAGDFKILTTCDSLKEEANIKQQQRAIDHYLDGRPTSSRVLTPPPSDHKFIKDANGSKKSPSPSKRERPSPYPPKTISENLDMEMYMLRNLPGLMPRSSTPIFDRQDVIHDGIPAFPSLQSYSIWSNYLKNTHISYVSGVTYIPEAMAGQFSPFNFPAFTNLKEMGSVPKIFKRK